MLDFFIVLGQVPGTNYFLSFADILWLSLILLVAPLVWHHRRSLAYEWTQRHITLFRLLIVFERLVKKLRFIRLAQQSGHMLQAQR